MRRIEPPKDGMTVRKHGQSFARDLLLERLTDVTVGDTVEVDWKMSNGLEVSKVGTVVERTDMDSSVDIRVRTGGPTDTCYLHVNTETKDVFFADDSRKAGNRELLQFNPR